MNKTMNRLFILIIFAICLLVSCDPVGNKSVMEPLTEKEKQELFWREDISFVYSSEAEVVREKATLSEKDKKDFRKLTYKRYSDYIFYTNKEGDKLEEKFGKEWDNQYGMYYEKVDSIDAYWRKKTGAIEDGRKINWREVCRIAPQCVGRMWLSKLETQRSGSSWYSKDFCYTSILKELLNIEIPGKSSYIYEKKEQCYKEKDELAYRFRRVYLDLY